MSTTVDRLGNLHSVADGRFQEKSNARPAGSLPASAEANWERLQREAELLDRTDPAYNSDLDIVVAGLRITYRELILAGISPDDEAAIDRLRDFTMTLPTQDPVEVRVALLDQIAPPPPPGGFWVEINAQLDRVEREAPTRAAEVCAILDGPEYHTVLAERGLAPVAAAAGRTEPRRSFFAGSGGDRSLFSALHKAGWSIVWSEASYYYVAQHPISGDVLTYIEGDVLEGDQRS